MSNWEKQNVIQLPAPKPRESTTLIVRETAWVVQLIPAISSGMRIFWERDTKTHSSAVVFFQTLFSRGHVTILCEWWDITKNSFLIVQDEDGEECWITVWEFVRLTAIDTNVRIDDYDEYIMSRLSALWVWVGMESSDIVTTEVVLDESDMDTYKPEEIKAFVDDNTFYICEIYHIKDAPIWDSLVASFDILQNQVTLLDLLVFAFDDAEINEYAIDWASADITYREWESSLITTIPHHLLEVIIFNAIKRVNPLYQNMKFSQARKHYFQNVVIKNSIIRNTLKPINICHTRLSSERYEKQ